MMSEKRTFTKDEYYLLWKFYSLCNLSYWFELDEFIENFDTIMNKIGKMVSVEGATASEHRALFAGESFDLKWEGLLKHLLPTHSSEINLYGVYVDSLSYVLELAKQNAVPDHIAKFVNPAAMPLYKKQQKAFGLVEIILCSVNIVDDQPKVVF